MLLRSLAARWRMLLVSMFIAVGAVVGPTAASAFTISATPSAVVFPDDQVDSLSGTVMVVTVENIDPGVAFLGPNMIFGADAGDFVITSDGCAFQPLFNAGDQCSIELVFQPTAAGARTATLEVDGGPNFADVALSGTGTIGTLTAHPAGLTFGPQPYYYGTIQQQGQIRNDTNSALIASSETITGPDASHFSLAYGDNCFAQTFYGGNGCYYGINFEPDSNRTGTYAATLTVNNDGTGGPLVIPLSATTTTGPHLAIASQVVFGDVTTGQNATRVLTVTNDGTDPAQLQQVLVLTPSPDVWYKTDDQCSSVAGVFSQTGLPAGASCTLTLHYKPQVAGRDSALLFIIGGVPQEPVTSVGLVGTGVSPGATPPPAPSAPAVLSSTLGGPAIAGGSLTCQAGGFGGSSPTTGWLRNGAAVPGATNSTLALSDTDVGATFSCTSSSASGAATSGASAPVRPRDLAGLPGSFVDSGVARRIVGAHRLRLGHSTIRLSGGDPATAWAPYLVRAGARVTVRLDGRLLGSGRTVSLSPRRLATFADGEHSLEISSGNTHTTTRILLLDATLAVHATGGPDRTTTISLAGRTGIGTVRLTLGSQLKIKATRGRLLGRITFNSADTPQRAFNLAAPSSRTNGVTVRLQRHTILISGLPAETGVVTISLRSSTVSGHGTTIHATTRLRGDSAPTTTVGPLTWQR